MTTTKTQIIRLWYVSTENSKMNFAYTSLFVCVCLCALGLNFSFISYSPPRAHFVFAWILALRFFSILCAPFCCFCLALVLHRFKIQLETKRTHLVFSFKSVHRFERYVSNWARKNEKSYNNGHKNKSFRQRNINFVHVKRNRLNSSTFFPVGWAILQYSECSTSLCLHFYIRQAPKEIGGFFEAI